MTTINSNKNYEEKLYSSGWMCPAEWEPSKTTSQALNIDSDPIVEFRAYVSSDILGFSAKTENG